MPTLDMQDRDTCKTCKHWEIIPTHGTRGDEGMVANYYKNCLLSLKENSQFAKFKFVHVNYGCDKHDPKTTKA